MLSYEWTGELKETLLNELTLDTCPSPNVSSSSTLVFLGFVSLAAATTSELVPTLLSTF